MEKKNRVSLIIATYKKIEFLKLIFLSLLNQSYKEFEVIVAEDDQSEDVLTFIKNMKLEVDFDIKHVSQPDRGFRKNKILNRAISVASGEYLVFIDGDCVLHKHFLREHLKRLTNDVIVFGRRVMLDKRKTENLLKTSDLKELSFLSILFSKSRKKEEAIYMPIPVSLRETGIIGCNMSVSKENIIKINGFDEDFETPYYGEDSDVFRRLKLIGIKAKCSKFNTIQYHLYHDGSGRDLYWEISEKLYKQKEKEGLPYCRNGLEKRE